MQFEALSVFCDVVRHRSFSKAAVANRLSQPAVSQIVSQLEQRLGVQLIDRSTRPLHVTAPGKAYYDGCKELVARYMELEASIRHKHEELALTVQVAAIYSVGLGDMGQFVELFQRREPGARVHVEYLHPDRVYEKVLDGTADLGLVSFPRKSRELTAVPWRQERMVLACAPGHPLARARSIRPEQLRGVKYVGFDRELAIRREVDRFFREQGVVVEIASEFDNIENIKKAIEVGAGVALLPEQTICKEVEAGTLVAVPMAGRRLFRPLGIIHRRHHKLTTASQRFLELLQADGAADEEPRFSSSRPNNGAGSSSKRNGRLASPLRKGSS